MPNSATGTTAWTIEPLYGSPWFVAIAGLAIIAVITLVTPVTEDPRRRKWLILLRALAGLVLLGAALRPAFIRQDVKPADAKLAIAIDVSRSMTLPDTDGADRWQSQQAALQALLLGLGDLGESLQVSLLSYDSGSNSLGTVQLSKGDNTPDLNTLIESAATLSPEGDLTDLGIGLAGAIDSATGTPLAGVIFMGDGTQTADSANGDQALRSAEVLDALAVPLWVVTIGPPGTDHVARDVAIESVPDSLQLFTGNQFELSFAVKTTGLANVSLPISISWIDLEGNRTEARTRQLAPVSAAETLAVNVEMDAPKPGLYRLEVACPKQSGEWVTANNSQIAFVEVRDGGGRILLIGGPGRPEESYLRRSLGGFPDLQIDSFSIRRGQTWPVSLEAALQPGQYNVYILGDIDSAALGTDQLQLLADRISEGAGLITMAGFQTYGVGGYGESPLSQVLPVQMDPARRKNATPGALTPSEKQERAAFQIPGPIKPQPTKRNPVTNLGTDPQSGQSQWETLPAMDSANRFIGPQPRSGVDVLLATVDGQPLLVTGGYGKGKVASLAFDETHRWWRVGQRSAVSRFWRQLMLWAMDRAEQSSDAVIAELDLRRFGSKQTTEFRARVQSLASQDNDIQLSAFLVNSDQQETALQVTQTSGPTPLIQGSLSDLEPGFYDLVVRANKPSIEPATVSFQVVDVSREMATPMADPVYLNQLADITASHGGAAYQPFEMDQLLAAIAEKRLSAETPVIEKTRLGDDPISGWVVFLIFTSLLACEWILRRMWGLA